MPIFEGYGGFKVKSCGKLSEGWLFHQANTPIHTSVIAVAAINGCSFELIQHPHTCMGPVVQSVISLTSLLVVKMLTVLVSIISYSQVFLLKKCE